MKKLLLAALVALCALFVLSTPSTASADEGRPGQRVWVSAASSEDAVAQITAVIVTGDEACFGSRRNHTCYGFSPLTRELSQNVVFRPIGANKNTTVSTIISLDTGMVVERNETGVIIARFQLGAEQQNGTAMFYQGAASILPALANGMGAAAIQTWGCGDRCGGGGPSAVAYSFSDAAAQSLLNATTLPTTAGPCTTCSRPATPQ